VAESYAELRARADAAAYQAAADAGLTDYGISTAQFQDLFASLITTESDWRMVPNSEGSGAYGLTQLMPGTAAELGVDPYDLNGNIAGGAVYLAQLIDRFNGNISEALAAYGGFVEKDPTGYVNEILGRTDIDPDKANKEPLPGWLQSIVDALPVWLRELFTLRGLVVLLAAAVLFFGGLWIAISSAGKE
jgi:hypothetical protein